MKPEVDRFLEVAAAYLMTQVAAALESAYQQSNATVLAAMLMAVREEFDRAVSRRVEENQELRRLFAEATSVVQEPGLRRRLAEAVGSQDASLTVADLERGNARLRGLLIELHAHVEGLASPQARSIEEAIWRELVASTERRRLMMGPF
jgi:hypothetical protein